MDEMNEILQGNLENKRINSSADCVEFCYVECDDCFDIKGAYGTLLPVYES